MNYNHKSETKVYTSDVRQIAAKIEAALDRRKPKEGTWAEMEKRMDDAASVQYQILLDLDGDQ